MMTIKEYRGICASCKHCETCTFIKNSERCVLNCGEFEEVWSENPTKSSCSPTKNICVENHNAPAGLCRTCENYDKCSFAKPETGVWSCMEYK
ncbi:MAG: hypothetical protein ABIH42_07715 [Planctomycetota bacterium]